MPRVQTIVLLTGFLSLTPCALIGQSEPSVQANAEGIRQLSDEVHAAEQRLQASEKELADLKTRLAALESTLAAGASPANDAERPVAPPPADLADTVSMQATQIATLDQTKVESSSKFPVKVSGIALMTASINSTGVDSPIDPTAALGGPGNTSLSLRQTVLGLDAEGPHLAGARSSADLRVDFYGAAAAGSYGSAGGLLRFRTAHAALDWQHLQLFFSFDRTLLNPNTPSSLVQMAEPGLSWSGNLWTWMPQLGASARFGQHHSLVLQGAWVSPPDAPYPAIPYTSSRSVLATLTEASRSLGAEGRIGFESGDPARGLRVGVGGYFAPHTLPNVGGFDSWAATMDVRIPLGTRADFTANAYRGAGLGGLGGGGYKDFVTDTEGTQVYLRAPEDTGGWTQLALHLRPTLDWNNSFGMDNVFGHDLRAYAPSRSGYGSIARNRTVTSNIIWSPRPYLPFSFEYRRIYTAPVIGPLWNTNVFAFAAGYRF